MIPSPACRMKISEAWLEFTKITEDKESINHFNPKRLLYVIKFQDMPDCLLIGILSFCQRPDLLTQPV
jgi:competence CoiA-like predicted nuclease